MKTKSILALLAAAFLVAACLPMPTQAPSPVASPVVAPATAAPVVEPTLTTAAWQTYTNAEAGFTLQMPPTWSQQTLPDQNNGAIHGMSFTGAEGGVEVYWGVGFGGACTTGTTQVQLAAGPVPACHATNTDGTQTWTQIDYQVPGGNSYSSRAYTGNAQPSSQDVVLQVLSTLAFMPPSQPQAGAGLANPASQNCVNQGGTVMIETRGDGGQYGVCLFEDNMQCEEWAMFHHDCPVGGIKVTGYVTPAATYCAITGGQYTVTGNSGAADEQGTCTFKDGSACDAWDYYNGKCVPGAPPVPAPATPSETETPAAGPTIQPLPAEVCNGMAQAMAHALDVVEVTQSEEPMSDPTNNASGTGCQATVKGTGEEFKDPDSVVKTLGAMLETEGYKADPMLIANGPTGEDQGYRNGDQICWAGAQWWPDASANCPQDQPVSACQVTPQQQDYTVTLNCGVETAQAPAAPTAQATPAAGAALANPASVNCAKQGGTLSIEEGGAGGQIGVCYFEDNRQCEEWALLRGDCPVGGLKVTGYITPAARYCAITGGQYSITGKSGAEDEQGTCTFKDGSQCDVWAYYRGECSAGAGAAASPGGGAGQIDLDSTRAGEYRDLWVMNSNGTKPTRLTEGDVSNFAGPWSPDGARIVYTCGGLTTTDICVINADGTGVLNLTNTESVDEGFPAWSPDGKQIAFTTRRDGNNEIYLMPAPAAGAKSGADSSQWVRLTNDPADDFAPAWSPDGAQIAFVSDRDQKPGIYDIYIMKADGSAVRWLTSDTAIDYSPAWSPDGTRVAFRSDHGGPGDIYVINVDGSGLKNLTNNPAADWSPSWSPDGTLIAFQTNRDGDWEIYTMNADGSAQADLTNDPVADDQLPFWRP